MCETGARRGRQIAGLPLGRGIYTARLFVSAPPRRQRGVNSGAVLHGWPIARRAHGWKEHRRRSLGPSWAIEARLCDRSCRVAAGNLSALGSRSTSTIVRRPRLQVTSWRHTGREPIAERERPDLRQRAGEPALRLWRMRFMPKASPPSAKPRRASLAIGLRRSPVHTPAWITPANVVNSLA